MKGNNCLSDIVQNILSSNLMKQRGSSYNSLITRYSSRREYNDNSRELTGSNPGHSEYVCPDDPYLRKSWSKRVTRPRLTTSLHSCCTYKLLHRKKDVGVLVWWNHQNSKTLLLFKEPNAFLSVRTTEDTDSISAVLKWHTVCSYFRIRSDKNIHSFSKCSSYLEQS